ncbi:peptide chain release factor N(5)-glutamine methyltransferase [Roseibium sp.]|uniref:peptide chain release factor N(5)-glutamine methyltransferase n=1 Tax=Roseibium sp. TaxID=1936156 RepID=UPI003A98676A
MNVGSLYREVRQKFREARIATPELDARVLIAGAMNIKPSDVLLRDADTVDADLRKRVDALTARRLEGVPVGRILGEREFWGLTFHLNEATLEPRPDTETLVETVLARCDPGKALTIADIGTGTGAIAISLLRELPNATCVAVDVSERALQCASENAKRLGVGGRFFPVRADYASALSGGLDWIVSNPPYIRTEVVLGLEPEVRDHDPRLALDGGDDGLCAYRQLVAQGEAILRKGSRIALEIGFDQGEDVRDLLLGHGFANPEIIKDLGGNDRVLVAVRG